MHPKVRNDTDRRKKFCRRSGEIVSKALFLHLRFLAMMHLIHTFLISISPFGEARVGIPYAILNDVPPVLAFVVGLTGNLLVFPIFHFLIDKFNLRLWRYRPYKKQSLKLAQRAKRGVGASVKKYGFWGLMLFVMIPLPVTGAYMGTIAAYVLGINRHKGLMAISIGVILSCAIVTVVTHLGKKGVEMV